MPSYLFRCIHCGHEFDRRCQVFHRDVPQVCDQCGNGAYRVFTPAAVTIPAGFSQLSASDVEMTLQQCRDQEKKNDSYQSPPTKPSFEDCLKTELSARGMRHPNKLTDEKAGFDKTCLGDS